MGSLGDKQLEILIVEDDPSTAKLIQKRLQAVGYDVSLASCGTAALEYTNRHQPDLIVLDIRLPDMTGFEVCHRLRNNETGNDVPILVLTTLSRPIDRLRGMSNGAQAFMTKPFDANELLMTIEELIGNTPAGNKGTGIADA